LTPADWARLERNAAEIFEALGLDLDTPGTRETPRRFVRALYDATAGYDGDPKLRTVFPAERPAGVEGRHAQIVEGPVGFYALCEHHALPFHGRAYIGYVAGTRSSASRSSRASCGSTHAASRCRRGSRRRLRTD
jgi:GTP cyclohydrolase I